MTEEEDYQDEYIESDGGGFSVEDASSGFLEEIRESFEEGDHGTEGEPFVQLGGAFSAIGSVTREVDRAVSLFTKLVDFGLRSGFKIVQSGAEKIKAAKENKADPPEGEEDDDDEDIYFIDE